MAFGTTINEVREINSRDIADINLRSMELNKSTLDEIKKGFTNLEKSVQKMGGGIRIPGLKSLTDMARSLVMMPKMLTLNLANAITAPFAALATTLTSPFIRAFTSVRDSLKATWEGTKKLFGGFFGFFGNIFGKFFGKGTDPKLISEIKNIGKSMSSLVSMFSKFLSNQAEAKLAGIEEKRDRKKVGGVLAKKGVSRSGNREGGLLGNLANVSEIMQGFGGFTGAILATVLAGGAVAFLVSRFRDKLGIDPGFSILDAINNKADELFGMPLFGETMTSALKSIGGAFAEGGAFGVLKEAVNQMLTAFPSLQTALDGMKTMWEETKIFFEGVVQDLGLGPLRDTIKEFIGKEFGIAEILALTVALGGLLSPLKLLRLGIAGLSVGINLIGTVIQGAMTLAISANTVATVALTKALASKLLSGGGLDLDRDGKGKGKNRARGGKRGIFQKFGNLFGAGDDLYDMNRGGKKGVQFGSKISGGALSLAESANVGKFAKFGKIGLAGARGIPIAGQVLAIGMAAYDGINGATEALNKFKPETLTESIGVGITGSLSGVAGSFASLADMATGAIGFSTDLEGGVNNLRDTFLNWSLDRTEDDQSEAQRMRIETDQRLDQLSNRLETEVLDAEKLAKANSGKVSGGAVIMDNSTSSNVQQNTTMLNGGSLSSVADSALRWAFPMYGD